MRCLFTSDLHGEPESYRALFRKIGDESPDAVFIGGDLLPKATDVEKFMEKYLFSPLRNARKAGSVSRCFVILGNDDPRHYEILFTKANDNGTLDYICERTAPFESLFVTGYPYIPPSPFMLKDWERYDVSRHVEPGCVPPEDGTFTSEIDRDALRHHTMKGDLARLAGNAPSERTIFLFHAPPYGGNLDRAALDGRKVDHAPLDVHIGSIAIERFIDERQPLLTLHGHVHESVRLTGGWRETRGRTHSFSGATDEDALSVVRFDAEHLEKATRDIAHWG
jgi:Icc-related predicted phosphoesterase